MQNTSHKITSSRLNMESGSRNGKTVFQTLKKKSLILITFYSVEAFTPVNLVGSWKCLWVDVD